MKILLTFLAIVGLALTLLPSLFCLGGVITEKLTFTLMTVGMVVWYLSATPLLGFEKRSREPSI